MMIKMERIAATFVPCSTLDTALPGYRKKVVPEAKSAMYQEPFVIVMIRAKYTSTSMV